MDGAGSISDERHFKRLMPRLSICYLDTSPKAKKQLLDNTAPADQLTDLPRVDGTNKLHIMEYFNLFQLHK